MSSRNLFWAVVIAIAAVAYLGSSVIELLVDYIWFDSLGFPQLFETVFLAKTVIGVLSGVFVFIFVLVNFMAALKIIGEPSQYLMPETAITPLGQLLNESMAKKAILLVSLVLAGLLGKAVGDSWETVLLYLNGEPFGVTDPIFQLDVGYYVFTLPILVKLRSFLWAVGLVAGVGVGLTYFLKMQAGRKNPAQAVALASFSRGERIHIALLGSYMLVLLAVWYYLDRFSMMHRGQGLFTGPGYADIFGTLPTLSLKIAASLICVPLLLLALARRSFRILIVGVVILAAAHFGGSAYVTILQRFVVAPNELEKERPYLKHHIEATNRAYALDGATERPLTEDVDLTAQDIRNNRPTINNIRLWDHEPLLDTFSQIQEIRTYYDFVSVDNDRYTLNGEIRQTMLSPRELNPASLPSRTWVNERLIFTHGYGLTLGPVNRVSEQGLPVLMVKDLPPATDYPELNITRPEIYYGEVADNYVFVNTNQQEFNYPEGDKNIFSTYEGEGGVLMDSLLRQLMFTIKFRDVKILLADDFTPKTRIMLYRTVRERVSKLAPFFHFDQDPYLVIDEGRLVWVLDVYTASARYPYSERASKMGNYMRNPVKAVVDAYSGRVTFYLMDTKEPLARAYANIFPGLVKPISEMPKGLTEHLRHPFDFFSVQASIYATYHMRDVNTFYNKEDQWEVPVVGQKRMEPYFTVMKLPGEQKEEFILMLPFTPRLKDNLAAWMVARSDGENYGKLVVYTFPKQKLIFGPKQMVARINQDPAVSQQITLWDQSGSNVIRGTLLVIPIENSLIYIQPLYLHAEEGRIPELKRVIVGYQNSIAMGIDLEDALAQIFGSDSSAAAAGEQAEERRPPPALIGQEIPVGLESAATRAKRHYRAMERASRAGDWSKFGRELEELGKALEGLSNPAR